MKKYYQFSFLIYISFVLPLAAQDIAENGRVKGDTNKVISLHQSAASLLSKGTSSEARLRAEEALVLSNQFNYQRGKAESLYWLGRTYPLQDASSALNSHLQSLVLAEQMQHKDLMARNYYEIGTTYENLKLYAKAADNLKKAFQTAKEAGNKTTEQKSLAQLTTVLRLMKNYDESEKYAQQFSESAKKQGNKSDQLRALNELYVIKKEKQQYPEAQQYAEEKFNAEKQSGDKLNAAYTANNLGFLARKQNNNNGAIQYFENALVLFKEVSANQNNRNSLVLNNIGVTYTQLGDYKKARTFYSQALSVAEDRKNTPEMVNANNYLAANEYISGNSAQALSNVSRAIELGEAAGATAELAESYQILSEIYAKENDFRKSQEADKKYQDLKNKLSEAENKRLEDDRQQLIQAEKREGEYRLLILDKQKQEAELSSLRLEQDKKNQELVLQQQQVEALKRDKELQNTVLSNQRLLTEKLQQDVVLKEKVVVEERRNQEIIGLQNEKLKQETAIKDQTLNSERQQKALDLLQQQKQLDDANLAREKSIQQYTFWVLGLIVAVLGVLIFSFFQKQRANRLLNRRNKEIEKQKTEIQQNSEKLTVASQEIQIKNEQLLASEEELKQNIEELETTQEAMLKQQEEILAANNKLKSSELILKKAYDKARSAEDEIRQKNARITDSIRYAERIQSAILASEIELNTHFAEHFVIYQPKDVVSGDFYWFSAIDGKKFFAAVDCTGHGVPGAFMSMIANSLLNQIVNEQKIHQPDKILENLHAEVKKALKQKDSANVDGMDLAICCLETWEDGVMSLKFSGAKTSVYCWHKNQVSELKGDRKSIGGFQKEISHSFTNHSIEVKKGDIIYLTTDGFTDAASPERKRLSANTFKECIEKVATKPLQTQRQEFISLLENHTQGTEQRDDITVLVLKI